MNKNINFFESLKTILSDNVLNLQSEQFDEFYDMWNLSFNASEFKNIRLEDHLIHKNQNIPSNAVLKGIDLPIWFGNPQHKKIVILGIDPLRSEKAFKKENANRNTDAIIGTPYAFHEKASRENTCKSYWTFVDGLCSAGNFVYCTDIFKTYFVNEAKNRRSYLDNEYTGEAATSIHSKILMQELELIQPDVIIVFGKLAHSFLLNKNCPKIGQSIQKTKATLQIKDKKIDVYTVLHLSKTPRGKSFKDFFENNGFDSSNINLEDRVQCAHAYIDILKREKIIEY